MTEITKNNSLEKVQEHLKAECFNKLFIGGHFVDPIDGQKMPTYYPATGEVFHELPKGNAKCIQLPVKQFGISLVTQTILRHARKLGIKIHFWTINNPKVMQKLLALDVDICKKDNRLCL